jgi:hypothetical protein
MNLDGDGNMVSGILYDIYSVPEPATMGFFALSGVLLVFCRCIRMK